MTLFVGAFIWNIGQKIFKVFFVFPSRLLKQHIQPDYSHGKIFFPEKLLVSQLVKKFHVFDGTPKVHYRAHNIGPFLPLSSQIIAFQDRPSYFLYRNFINLR